MRTVFLPSLVHPLTGDPGLWVDLLTEGRSVLLDMGDLTPVASRKLLRVERALVSHTHMDHFIGFDHLLRLMLGREKQLVVTGPEGFLAQVRGRIGAYTWNLVRDYPVCIVAEEIAGNRIRAERYTGAGGMEPEPLPDRPFHGVVHAERLYTFHVDVLDHGIPVLAAALRETEHLSVNRDRLDRMGLRPGPWLREVKQAVRRCQVDDRPVTAEAAGGEPVRLSLAELAEALILRSPGQRLAYVTDMAYTPSNVERAAALAADADLLVCEAAFLHEDRELAKQRLHLTARQAGELARAAGAKRLAPFHLSPRYQGREHEILQEAREAFGGPVLALGNEATRRWGSAV